MRKLSDALRNALGAIELMANAIESSIPRNNPSSRAKARMCQKLATSLSYDVDTEAFIDELRVMKEERLELRWLNLALEAHDRNKVRDLMKATQDRELPLDEFATPVAAV